MAIPWLALPATLAVSSSEIRQEIVDEKLVIEWKTKTAYLPESKVVFGGGVKATYGVTVLTADTLTIFYGQDGHKGIAEGNVHIDDPEGDVMANRLQFDWVNRTGEADNVTIDVYPMLMQAQKLKVEPGRWELTNVKVMECGIKPAFYSMWSPSVIIRPGQSTIAKQLSIAILGQKIATLRRHQVSLDRKNEGIRLPSISIRRGAGLGVTWQNGVPLTNSTYTDFRFSAFPHRRPSASLIVNRSFLDPDNVQTLLTPRSDLSELFSYGYLENINVAAPANEREYLTKDRATLSIGSVLNAGVTGRDNNNSISKPWEIVAEIGGPIGGISQVHQIRLQDVRQIGREPVTRAVAVSSIKSPVMQILPELDAGLRADARWFQSVNGRSSGWGRIIGELNWQPAESFRLGVGLAFGSNIGEFEFEFDPLPRERTFHVRADLNLGPTRINVLQKFDLRGKDWYDLEFAIHQVAGCFEPYYIYRRVPGTTSFGVRFRVFEAFDRLKDRVPQRAKSNRPKPKPMDHPMFGEF